MKRALKKVGPGKVSHGEPKYSSKYGYKSTWEPMSMNKSFWREVLVARTIKKVSFDEDGIYALHLDDGQRIFIAKDIRGLFIKD